jgi:hypothetical protein
MWSARAIAVACIGLAAITSGCDPLERRYFREGAGVDLYTAELGERTNLQDLYLGYICRQAGLSTLASGEQIPFCDFSSLGTVGWMLLVQAGMNDVDQRCDAYLTWLDYKKRWSGAVTQEIQDTQTATNLILSATETSPGPIAIVGAAFGFATHTFTNFNSRLLLEVDQSTVQSVVLTRQKQFRSDLPKVIDNRAAAVYALRSYLRLCLPMTIETQINTTVKLFERGGTAALENAKAHPMIDAQNVRSATIRDVTAPMGRPFRAPVTVDAVRVGLFEQSLVASQVRKFQCLVGQSQDGKFTADTRMKILAFLMDMHLKDSAFPDRITAKDGTRLRDALDARSDC